MARDQAPTSLPTGERPLTVKDAAARLGVKRSAVYALASKGELQSVRVGRRVVIYPESVEEYKKRHSHVPEQQPDKPSKASRASPPAQGLRYLNE